MKQVIITSFGYGHDAPPCGADLVVDTRVSLRNPHEDPTMRELTGLDRRVIEYVMATPGARRLTKEITEWAYRATSNTRRNPVQVAIGCVGGRHRSVAVAEAVAAGLRLIGGMSVQVNHRDVGRAVLPSTARP